MGLVAAECKLPLAPARVVSTASRGNPSSLHALWPIKRPRPIYANQDAELSSTGQSEFPHTSARHVYTGTTSRDITFQAVPFPIQIFVLWSVRLYLIGFDKVSLESSTRCHVTKKLREIDHIILILQEERVSRFLDEGHTMDLVYLGFAKAFDSVNHRFLLA